MCLCSYGVSVHESPDPGGNFTGKQDNQAGEELQDTHKKTFFQYFVNGGSVHLMSILVYRKSKSAYCG